MKFNVPDSILPVEMQAVARKLERSKPPVKLDHLVLPVLPARSLDELLRSACQKTDEI